MKPDETDERILGMLRHDARKSNVAIAKSLGMTEGAVRWRIMKLIEGGVIRRFTIETGSGADISAVIMLKARGETKKMMASVAGLGMHTDAYEISGEFDGCVIVEGSSVEDLDSKVDLIRKLNGVEGTRTFISFRRW